MFSPNLRNKINLWFLLLFIIVFIIWAIFFFNITDFLRTTTRQNVDHTSNLIMTGMSEEFLQIEQLSFMLASNGYVKDFATTKDTLDMNLRAKEISELVNTNYANSDFISNLIIFNQTGNFYRYMGSLSNSSCKKIYTLVKDFTSPKHSVVELENINYTCYVHQIYSDVSSGDTSGIIVILVEKDKILEMLTPYVQQIKLDVGFATDNTVIVSNHSSFVDKNILDIENQTHYFVSKQIGLTPFKIFVSAEKGYLNNSIYYFSIATVVTAIVFGLILASFLALLNKQFISPMLTVIKNVENINLNISPTVLPYISDSEFNTLVIKINDMLIKLDAKNKEFQQAEIELKNAEIEKQKAIVFSLKKQINAHFTINFLNIIEILIANKSYDRAIEICHGLSAMVRYAYAEDEFINAWDEFLLLEKYISIMNIRFNDKLSVNFDVSDELIDLRMPRMLLQPIVENAILHGFKDMKDNCVIDITGEVIDNKMIISVSDNGCGMTEMAIKSLQDSFVVSFSENDELRGIENIALININKRLKSYYGPDYGLSVKKTDSSGTGVTFTLILDTTVSTVSFDN